MISVVESCCVEVFSLEVTGTRRPFPLLPLCRSAVARLTIKEKIREVLAGETSQPQTARVCMKHPCTKQAKQTKSHLLISLQVTEIRVANPSVPLVVVEGENKPRSSSIARCSSVIWCLKLTGGGIRRHPNTVGPRMTYLSSPPSHTDSSSLQYTPWLVSHVPSSTPAHRAAGDRRAVGWNPRVSPKQPLRLC